MKAKVSDYDMGYDRQQVAFDFEGCNPRVQGDHVVVDIPVVAVPTMPDAYRDELLAVGLKIYEIEAGLDEWWKILLGRAIAKRIM